MKSCVFRPGTSAGDILRTWCSRYSGRTTTRNRVGILNDKLISGRYPFAAAGVYGSSYSEGCSFRVGTFQLEFVGVSTLTLEFDTRVPGYPVLYAAAGACGSSVRDTSRDTG
eukprot:1418156-Rhodomonas_salina.1